MLVEHILGERDKAAGETEAEGDADLAGAFEHSHGDRVDQCDHADRDDQHAEHGDRGGDAAVVLLALAHPASLRRRPR
ncbi:MAG TPA: hypothetical protein VKG38_03730 [Solirubrobacteraceae bacterium]|nr:hypothetical protein [Solirubrobacteraceae bacterium]